MFRYNTAPAGPRRAALGTARLPGQFDDAAQAPLSGVSEWVRLCQQCASMETQHQSPLALARRNVVISLKPRCET